MVEAAVGVLGQEVEGSPVASIQLCYEPFSSVQFSSVAQLCPTTLNCCKNKVSLLKSQYIADQAKHIYRLDKEDPSVISVMFLFNNLIVNSMKAEPCCSCSLLCPRQAGWAEGWLAQCWSRVSEEKNE